MTIPKALHKKLNHKHLLTVPVYTIVLVLLAYTCMFREITVPNERTRIYLSIALVDDGSVSISKPVKRFGKTADMAKYKGQYYSDKAPGTGFLGAVVYKIARCGSTPEEWNIFDLVNLMRQWLMLPMAMVAFFLLRRLLGVFALPPRVIDIASVSWILGSAAFHYSTAFYGHQPAAIGLILSLLCLRSAEGSQHSAIQMLLAGAGCGFSGLMEYQSVIPTMFMLVYIAAKRRNLMDILFFLLGGLPFAAMLLGYNWAAFDGPFELSYHHLASKKVQALHNVGIGGVSFPKTKAVFGSLLSLHRGLLTTSPIFLLLPLGIWRMAQKSRPLAILSSTIIVYYLLFIFSADAWYAGWSFGPRLLVPMMGLAMVPIAFAIEYLINTKNVYIQGLLWGLCIAGVFYHQAVHLVFPELPETARNPMMDLILPAFQQGIFSPNFFSRLMQSFAYWQIIPVVLLLLILIGFLAIAIRPDIKLLKLFRFFTTAMLPVIILTIYIVIMGPAWSTKKTTRFLQWMQEMSETEYTQK